MVSPIWGFCFTSFLVMLAFSVLLLTTPLPQLSVKITFDALKHCQVIGEKNRCQAEAEQGLAREALLGLIIRSIKAEVNWRLNENGSVGGRKTYPHAQDWGSLWCAGCFRPVDGARSPVTTPRQFKVFVKPKWNYRGSALRRSVWWDEVLKKQDKYY